MSKNIPGDRFDADGREQASEKQANPYFAGAQAQDGPDLNAGAPTLRLNEDQRLNRKALVFLAGIIALLVVAAVFIYGSATSGVEEDKKQAEEQVVIPELPREPQSFKADPAELPVPQRREVDLPPLPADTPLPMMPPSTDDLPRGPRRPTLVERRMGAVDAGTPPQDGEGGSQAQDPFVQALMQANGMAPAKPESGPSGRKGSAQFLNNPDALLVRGTYIRCVLAMRIVTDIPGFTSCMVAEPVYSINGRRMLVPKGSRILGRYDTEATGPRVAVVWDRITTPTGIDINMTSPGVDGLGGAGHPGKYSAHWPSRIASALLVSLISDVFKYEGEKHGPTSTAYYGNGAVVEQPFESNTARTLQRLADQAVDRSASRPATVTINQGTVLNVYVAQDIDFTEVLPRVN